MKRTTIFFLLSIFMFAFSINTIAQDNSVKIERDVLSDKIDMKVPDNSPKIRPGETIVEGTTAVLRTSLPFEGFEDVTFPPTGWTRVIVEGGATQRWVRVTNITGYGMSNGAAQYNFFNSSAGDKQYLQTPDFAASVSGEILQFDYAYSTFTGAERDSLTIQVSSNGVDYTDLRVLYGDTNAVNIPEINYLITAPKTTASANIQDHQWNTMRIALPVGTISIRFLARSAFGNNLYLDNIGTFVPAFGAPMSGTYTINPLQPPSATNFQTFTAAANDLYDRGISGPVTINVSSGVYTERFHLKRINGSSSTNTITFQRLLTEGASVTLNVSNATTTNSTTDYGIALIGCEYVTIRGIDIYDVGTTTATYINRGIVIGTSAGRYGANNINIEDCEIGLGGMNVGGTVQAVSTGIVGTGAVNGVNSSALTNITIDNCKIDNADRGIGFFPFLGAGTVPYPGFANINVTDNTLGSIRALGMTLTGGGPIGIILQGTSNGVCNNNVVDTLRISATGSTTGITGIALQVYSGECSSNRIRNIFHANTSSTTPILTGIQAGPYSGENTLISNNTITGMIRNWTGAATATQLLYGIQATNFVTGISPASVLGFVNNSVYLSNPGTVNYTSGAFRSFGSGLPVIIYNNLFYNSMSSSSATAKHYAIIDANATRAFLDSDYNDLVSTGTNGFVGRFSTTDATTLADWRTATVDANSVSGAPVFLSLSNLSIDVNVAANWILNGNATPTPFVPADIVGNTRSIDIQDGATDIGAYEFTPETFPPVVNAVPAPALNGTSSFSFGGRLIASIEWGNTGTVPTDVEMLYFPGIDPPVPPAPPLAGWEPQYGNAFYSFEPTGGAGFEYDITIHYTENQLGTIDFESNIKLAKSDDGVNWNLLLLNSEADTLANTVTATGLTSFSLFALTDTDNPLPVSISSFTSNVDRNNVTLNWSTEWEENCMKFDIQRKLNDPEAEWTIVGSVNGSGTVYEERNYSFTDRNLPTGKYEYRLVQFDYDGNSTADFNLNQIVEVGIPTRFDLTQNYPNPFNPTTKIDFQIPVEGLVKLSVFDMSGREVATLVNEVLTPGYYTYDFNATYLSSGAYFYRLSTANNVITKRMVLVK